MVMVIMIDVNVKVMLIVFVMIMVNVMLIEPLNCKKEYCLSKTWLSNVKFYRMVTVIVGVVFAKSVIIMNEIRFQFLSSQSKKRIVVLTFFSLKQESPKIGQLSYARNGSKSWST